MSKIVQLLCSQFAVRRLHPQRIYNHPAVNRFSIKFSYLGSVKRSNIPYMQAKQRDRLEIIRKKIIAERQSLKSKIEKIEKLIKNLEKLRSTPEKKS